MSKIQPGLVDLGDAEVDDVAAPLLAKADSVYGGKPDVVVMRDRSYFFSEGDELATIDVMRLGDCTTTVKVGYTTVGSGGGDFTPVHGTLVRGTARPDRCLPACLLPPHPVRR